jgi:molybdopterin synthase sulfur carrier subunit
MAIFRIPCSLRDACGGASEVRATGADLNAALHDLEARYPALQTRLADSEGNLREFVRLFVNDLPIEVGSRLSTPLQEDDAVSILPAVCGG